MRIFLDLDDTLIYTLRGEPKNIHDISRLKSITFELDGCCNSVYRAIAPELISFCRSIDPDTSIITTATKEWAEAWSNAFDMGFDSEHIYARHDYTEEEKIPSMPGFTRVVWNGNSLHLKSACIIDNYDIRDMWIPSPDQKMKFVFGPRYREYQNKMDGWITIPPFEGINQNHPKQPDLEALEQQTLTKIKEKIEKLSKNT